jgi:hypothetical protein
LIPIFNSLETITEGHFNVKRDGKMKLNNQPSLNGNKQAIYTVKDFDLQSYQDVISIRSLPIYQVTDNQITFPQSYVNGHNQDKVNLPLPITEDLFDYQKVLVKVGFLKEKYGFFLDPGTGKTFILGELARQIHSCTEGRIVICLPLNIMHQFEQMVKDFFPDFPAYDHLHRKSLDDWCKHGKNRIAFVNHEAFIKPVNLTGVDAFLLDESSILKGGVGGNAKISKNIIAATRFIKYKFAASGTPSPNDKTEYAMHTMFAELVKSANEFYAQFFTIKDDKYVLRKHADEAFYQYLSHFSIFMRSPKAYGFKDNLEGLKPWIEINEKVDMTDEQIDYIIRKTGRYSLLNDVIVKPRGMTERTKFSQISKGFVYNRDGTTTFIPSNKPVKILELVQKHSPNQVIIWTVFDEEGNIIEDTLKKAGINTVHITGKTDEDKRLDYIDQFRENKIQVIISKPRILGFGLNFQFCHIAIFSGLQDSYESYYQAVKRIHRYGQNEQVLIYHVYTAYEEAILQNVLSKKEEMDKDFAYQENLYVKSLFKELQDFLSVDYKPKEVKRMFLNPVIEDYYQLYHGDSIKMMLEVQEGKSYGWLKENSIDFSVFSPPFMGDVFTYTNDPADMGNTRGAGALGGVDEFMIQFRFFLEGMLAVTKPGRLMAVHLEDVPLRKGLDGFIGIFDFVGRAIQEANKAGWILFGKIPILKNQQMQAIVKHVSSLSMGNMETDRARIAPSNNGYLCLFKKPGENLSPITNLAKCDDCNWQGYAQDLQFYNGEYLLNYKKFKGTKIEFLCPKCNGNNIRIHSEMDGDKWIIYAEGIWPEHGFNENFDKIAKQTQNQRWGDLVQTALGVWYDISEADVLRTSLGDKDNQDADKHLCPLPYQIARRAIEMYTNPDEIVFTPFMGSGTEVHAALSLHRKAIGIELKKEYFVGSCKVAEGIVNRSEMMQLF